MSASEKAAGTFRKQRMLAVRSLQRREGPGFSFFSLGVQAQVPPSPISGTPVG
jgi:hypothetical protein